MHRPADKPAVVLLVEDDPGDQELTRRALTDEMHRVDLRIVSDGEEALEYLERRGAYVEAETSPKPDLILLDLNLPKLDGREVLERLKASKSYRKIPVIVLTTSRHDADIVCSYDLGCNSFISKPVEVSSFVQTLHGLGDYWFELVTLVRQ